MISLLNKGLNFSILPDKIDNTQILTEHKRFERTMFWKSFWAEKGNSIRENDKVYIFRSKKNNFPRNYNPPESLKTFLGSVKYDLMDPSSRKRVPSNLNIEEQQGLYDLIELQKNGVLTLKQCDKGAGIIILNNEAYLKSCYDHLNMTYDESGLSYNYYDHVDE